MSVTLTTSLGDIKVEIFCEAVPKTAENFLALCATGAYDQSPIHRIIPSFIFQTGSPASDTKSKTSISIYGEGFEDEIRPSLRHNARGILSMANRRPNDNGSQFFVCFAPQPQLDGRNTVFGKVIDGFDTLDKLEGVNVDSKGRSADKITIQGVQIHANPLA